VIKGSGVGFSACFLRFKVFRPRASEDGACSPISIKPRRRIGGVLYYHPLILTVAKRSMISG
jgi:hypothetical protein